MPKAKAQKQCRNRVHEAQKVRSLAGESQENTTGTKKIWVAWKDGYWAIRHKELHWCSDKLVPILLIKHSKTVVNYSSN